MNGDGVGAGSTHGRPRVLVVGLDPTRAPGPWDPQPIVDQLAAGMSELSAQGVDAVTCLLAMDDLDRPGGAEAVERIIEGAVRGRVWDCVLVGGGLRTDAQLLWLFERVVNLARVHVPEAAIAFNERPDGLWEAVSRWLPGG